MRKSRQADNARIIRDIRNSNMDYWIPRVRAEELYKEGKLVKIEAYKDKWCFATRETHEYYV
jgi:hypothetical protein